MASTGQGQESAMGRNGNGTKAAAAGSALEFKPDRYFIGKQVELYSPPGHILALAYGTRLLDTGAKGGGDDEDDDEGTKQKPAKAKSNENPIAPIGFFACRLLYAEYDERGDITNATIEYEQGRRWVRRDSLNLRGCAVSYVEERADYVAPTKKTN